MIYIDDRNSIHPDEENVLCIYVEDGDTVIFSDYRDDKFHVECDPKDAIAGLRAAIKYIEEHSA